MIDELRDMMQERPGQGRSLHSIVFNMSFDTEFPTVIRAQCSSWHKLELLIYLGSLRAWALAWALPSNCFSGVALTAWKNKYQISTYFYCAELNTWWLSTHTGAESLISIDYYVAMFVLEVERKPIGW